MRILYAVMVLVVASCGVARNAAAQQPRERAEVLAVAHRIMGAARFATLVTVDESGQPIARIVDPFPPDSHMVIWIGTNPRTRKVAHVGREPRVVLSYFDVGSMAYVTVTGRASVVGDAETRRRYFKPEWDAFYPDRDRDYTLIRVVPERLEIVSERDRVTGDSLTWRPPFIDFRR